ncbi:stalk domain-containing protein [Marinicrinis lubricantis]|uniref:Stalk domain-containing protein n=2 Tax=Marinicrinis lubricantis TaxID=2086470 RepID=A0ABW1IK08_9BACL
MDGVEDEWDMESQEITIWSDYSEAVFQIGELTAWVNGVEVPLMHAPYVEMGINFIPLVETMAFFD